MYRLTTFAGRMRTVVAATRRGWALAPSERMARHCCQGRRHYGSPAAAEPFLSGSSGIYVEEMYNAWLQNPASVHKVTQLLLPFSANAVAPSQDLVSASTAAAMALPVDRTHQSGTCCVIPMHPVQLPPSMKSWDVFFRNTDRGAAPGAAYQPPPGIRTEVSTMSVPIVAAAQFDTEKMLSTKVIDDHLAVQAIIRSYQVVGHRFASLDPLDICHHVIDPDYETIKAYHLEEPDLDRVFQLPPTTYIGGGGDILDSERNHQQTRGTMSSLV
ncbi:2-oxoglutarate dehydrogenase, mitochondrial [Lamellibrachia satsuma]|nr:2-oxoglutarate dehydrogenase, mitochondrial [Lamellibrachia satsuma]